MIEITNLNQSYKNKHVLKNINLTIEKNEHCALVGRNGAGKSTLIHSMLGLLPVKQGSVRLGGHSIKKEDWKQKISYLPEKFQLYPHMTGEENMRFFASLDSKPVDEKKVEENLKLVSLWEDRHHQIKGYSKGMLQRLGLCVMLYYDTDILILDEPTSGLDPLGRKEVLDILKSLSGKTIFMSSHHMDEIKQTCTHVAFLQDGTMTKYTVDDFMNHHLEEGVGSK